MSPQQQAGGAGIASDTSAQDLVKVSRKTISNTNG
jgi:hypothetical protein